MSNIIKIGVTGAAGRMGQANIKALEAQTHMQLSGAFEHHQSDFLGKDATLLAGLEAANVPIEKLSADRLEGLDVIIDFTRPQATLELAALCAQTGVHLVTGTTGMTEVEENQLAAFAKNIVIVKSGNMSLGVNLLAGLVKKAAAALDEDFDIEILEMHHRMKVDAPSGTALMLGEAAARGRDIELRSNATMAREGITGARENGTIGFATLRGGTVVGDHSAIFAGEHETITLSHRAESREIFSQGAVKAAKWVHQKAQDKAPGFYAMADVLGL